MLIYDKGWDGLINIGFDFLIKIGFQSNDAHTFITNVKELSQQNGEKNAIKEMAVKVDDSILKLLDNEAILRL